MKIKLQLFHDIIKIVGIKGHYIFHNAIVRVFLSTMYSLQHPCKQKRKNETMKIVIISFNTKTKMTKSHNMSPELIKIVIQNRSWGENVTKDNTVTTADIRKKRKWKMEDKPKLVEHSQLQTKQDSPTAPVVFLSSPAPTWSAWALVLSSNIISLALVARGRYCRRCSSLMPTLLRNNAVIN